MSASAPTARPTAPRLLAIPPPSGAVDLACVDAWLDAGVVEASLAVLLREPGAAPAALLDPHGRLAALRRRCRDLGLPLLLGCDAAALPGSGSTSPPLSTPTDLAGIQLRGDPSPAALAEARARLPPTWLLGRSCHGPPAGSHGLVDYTCLAPIFPPTTPQPGVHKSAMGLDRLAAWAAEPGARLIALGGVVPRNAAACLAAGAYGLAGIGLFFGDPARVAQDVAAVVTALQARDVQPLPPGPRP